MKTNPAYKNGLFSVLSMGIALGVIMGFLFAITIINDFNYAILFALPFIGSSLILYLKNKDKIKAYENILKELK